MAEQGKIQLPIPSFALIEPVWTARKRRAERTEPGEGLSGAVQALTRTTAMRAEAESARDAARAVFAKADGRAESRLDDPRRRPARCADILALSAEALLDALDLEQEHDLPAFDAVILATVLRDPALGTTPACFINANRTDFDVPSIAALLAQRECRLIANFEGGLGHVSGTLSGP